ncbi:MAG: helix-turn-helix transcriptional regulator [Myxococcota bacterium]
MLDTLSPPKRTLVDLIKALGAVTVDDLAARAGLGKTTVRQHLDDLLEAGLVAREPHRLGRGRPTYHYDLSEAGYDLYPSGDGALLRELLLYLARDGQQETIRAFFDRFWASRSEEIERRVRAAGDDSLDTRVGVLRSVLRQEGFMPDIERHEDGTVTVRERNCPYRQTVRATLLPCRLEAEFIQRALGAEVRRVAYMPQGAKACTYDTGPGEAGS